VFPSPQIQPIRRRSAITQLPDLGLTKPLCLPYFRRFLALLRRLPCPGPVALIPVKPLGQPLGGLPLIQVPSQVRFDEAARPRPQSREFRDGG
jgi:hypothetical protein